MKQIYAAHASAASAFTLPDLAAALKQIQTQYDDIAAKNLQVKSCLTIYSCSLAFGISDKFMSVFQIFILQF